MQIFQGVCEREQFKTEGAEMTWQFYLGLFVGAIVGIVAYKIVEYVAVEMWKE